MSMRQGGDRFAPAYPNLEDGPLRGSFRQTYHA